MASIEVKILEGLTDLGYTGPLREKKNLEEAIQEGPKNVEYTKLVCFLTDQLRPLLNIDEQINSISGPEDSVAFIMEVGSFLKELSCSYAILTQGHVSDRLQTKEHRLLLLDYLATELMAARILQDRKPDKKIELKLQETEEAANMRKILMSLRFPKPPPNITIPQLFEKLCPTLQSTINKVGAELVGKPAFNGTLSDKQWETLKGVQNDLNEEYKIRREMLLTRLDVTIQSFQWSDKTKGKDEMIEKIYADNRRCLKTTPEVELADVLAARDDIAIIEKTSSATVRKNTRSSLNKVIIGEVPDRGGRTSEQAPPPPEMPSWQQRTPGPSGGARGGRGGGNFSRGKKPTFSIDSRNYANNQEYDNRSNYSRDSGNYSGYDNSQSPGNSYNAGYNQSRSFDSAGSYGAGSHSGGGSYDNRGSYDSRSYDSAERPTLISMWRKNSTTSSITEEEGDVAEEEDVPTTTEEVETIINRENTHQVIRNFKYGMSDVLQELTQLCFCCFMLVIFWLQFLIYLK